MAKNFEHIIHKHSATVTNGNPKLPVATDLELGELAVNYAKDNETISLKNSNNEIVTFSSDSQINEKFYTKEEIDDDHLVISSSLNDLNTRVISAENVIETVKVNGTALTPDESKAVDITVPSAVTVDSELNGTSENPVQNKVIYEALSAKQNVLTFDTVPTENSTNPVTSGGVYNFLSDDELVISSALNDLNSRSLSLESRMDTAEDDIASKQETLVSGTNIKTINNEPILGEGNLTITGSTVTFRQW